MVFLRRLVFLGEAEQTGRRTAQNGGDGGVCLLGKEIGPFFRGGALFQGRLLGLGFGKGDLRPDQLVVLFLSRSFLSRSFLDGGFLSRSFLDGGFLSRCFFDGGFLGGGFLNGSFLYGGFLNGSFLGGSFLGGSFLNGSFLDRIFLDRSFLGGGFFNGNFLDRGFLGGGFFNGNFLGGGFLDGGFFDRGFLSRGFLDRGFLDRGFLSGSFLDRSFLYGGFLNRGFLHGSFLRFGLLFRLLLMGQAGKQSGSDQASAVQLFFRLRFRFRLCLCFRLGRSCNGSIFYALQLYVRGLVGILRRHVGHRFRFRFRLCFRLMGSGGKTGGDQPQAVQFFFRLRFRFGAQLSPVQSGGPVRVRLFLFFRFRLRIRLRFCLRLVGGGEESGGDQAQTGGSANVRDVGLVIRGKGILLRSAGQGAQRGHLRGQGVHVHVVRIRRRFRQTLVRRALVQPLVAGDQLCRKACDLLPLLVVGG